MALAACFTAVAVCVFRAGVVGAIVGVAEVEVSRCGDALAAADAGDRFTVGDACRVLCPEFVVGVVVAALLACASCSFAFRLMVWAAGGGGEFGTSGGCALTQGWHWLRPRVSAHNHAPSSARPSMFRRRRIAIECRRPRARLP